MRLSRLLVAGLVALWATQALAQPQPLLVFAAASLKNALDEAAASWAGSVGVRTSYAASSALARQLEQGAPADLFISADTDWMDWVAARHLIRADTRLDLLGNRLVLIAPAASGKPLALRNGMDLAGALGGGRLAIADPDVVPAGKYGKAALEALGVWDQVRQHLARAENVRAALAFVARGEAPLGIVYASDAVAEPGVKVAAAFASDQHPPIVYPVAVTAISKNPEAGRFLAFLASDVARPIFEKYGFTVLVTSRARS
jgi:molybdate transport system substrate-binding protein